MENISISGGVSYETLKEATDRLGGTGPFAGKNQDNESVIVFKSTDDKYFKTETCQNNGWSRINFFWEDGSIEETYEKCNK